MTSPAYVSDFRYSLGSERHSVAESAHEGRTLTAAGALEDAGFRYHHVCSPDQSAYDLALGAVGDLAKERGDTLDAIVYATCLPANASVESPDRFTDRGDVKHLMDFAGSRLQADLGLHRSIVIGLNQQACTSMLGSIRMAHALLAVEPEMQDVLCLSADRFPPGARYEQAYSLISDGAAACVVGREPKGYRLLAAEHITNGAMVQADDDETVGAYFSYTNQVVQRLLAKAGRTAADVSWVVPQNTNVKAWQILARLLGIDESRVFHPSLPDVAHVISGDNMVNMAYLEESGRAAPGDVLLLVMAGYGMNWQGLLLEKV
ncbi:MAG TPA: 3-oxoacyl-[acyl-carrier-protein] synthase III C-terminal domain-containing protein [Mycobacteriales bacterium]|nr:3-oxoacyl-[acyl-carrier-protein] synthase III C-terminal domain-containing protein [Mycobacteriales bacterium]